MSVLLVAYKASAVGLPEHCPDHNGHPGKLEASAFSDGLNNMPLDVGTVFCVKAAGQSSGVLTVVDGQTTPINYVTWLNNGGQTPDVSYVVIYQEVPSSTTTSTTTSTTVIESTTTTAPSTTTSTTSPVTPTTEPSTTTTTQEASSSTTVVKSPTTTSPSNPSTSTPTESTPSELPYTGPVGVMALILAGSGLIGGGVAVLRRNYE